MSIELGQSPDGFGVFWGCGQPGDGRRGIGNGRVFTGTLEWGMMRRIGEVRLGRSWQGRRWGANGGGGWAAKSRGFKFEPTLRTNIKSGTKNGGMSAPIGKRFTSALPLLLIQNVIRHI